jgi:cytochrome oxidase Cu insertion factor (SCO1/SenC/PrrC family)
MTSKLNPKFAITLLILIFAMPMACAWIAYSKGFFLSMHTINHGQLINPPLEITQLSLVNHQGQPVTTQHFRGKWWLIYIHQQSSCGLVCKKTLYDMRQIRQATGKDRERIARAVITFQDNPDPNLHTLLEHDYPNTQHLMTSRSRFLQLLQQQNLKKLAITPGSLYLVDPLGNVMMFYKPDAPPKGVLKDLQRVLKVSQIG